MNQTKSNKGKVIIAVVIIIFIGTAIFTYTNRKNMTVVENVFGQVINPIQGIITKSKNKLNNSTSFFSKKRKLISEKEKVEKENKKLKDQVLKYETIVGKKDYLKNEYELKENSKYKFTSAVVTAKDPGSWFENFTINKGTNNGFKEGDNVILGVEEKDKKIISEGLVGKIMKAGKNWSKVSSIIDSGNSVSFELVKNRETGILKGNSKGKLEGYLFDTDSKVSVGDKVTSSGIGDVYKESMYIGKVIKVNKKTDDLRVHITVEPAINFNKIHDVFIIEGKKE